MIRPLELVNTVLLAAITVLLAIQLLAPPPERAVLMSAPEFPSIPCRVPELFGGGEEHSCVPVRVLDAP